MKQETTYLAGGCFWGVEYFLQKQDGVLSTAVGYMGGETNDPTYQEVCRKNTGHAEVLEVVFDADRVSFETLARLFFEIHDPTQKDRQGPDIGSQYRSAIFYTTEEQKQVSESLITILKDKGYNVVTKLLPAEPFWKGEDYHQQYYKKNGSTPYCHIKEQRFN